VVVSGILSCVSERADLKALIDRMSDVGATVATAESLTGGRLAARLTEVPGSSAAYVGGVVSYATEVKVKVLGVPPEVVDQYGVVSAECAEEMASGVRSLLGATFALSTTGVAGPDRQEGKPVGTVYVALAGPAGVETLDLDLDGDRDDIQRATVAAAIELLVRGVSEVSGRIGSAGRGSDDPGLG
jgi:PncC family amidohydrolase